MTVLEISHSLTQPEIDQLVKTLESKIPTITDFPLDHRARLIKPMLGYDGSAIALGFLPAAGEGFQQDRSIKDDEYTYHHLRRDVYQLSSGTGVKIASRYTVPSSHITIGRFVTGKDFCTANGDQVVPNPEKMQGWISTIEEINKWLREKYWPKIGDSIAEGGQWIIGQEQGLDCRKGRLWYGGGETVRLGQGF
ncbi:60s ribosomal protein l44 protein [Lasallia pustulata]|uniref:60s ribosomal protein l44 protein n=1 Tax=Lasallia pustulata TaxID=136370 RepID=A0A1W5CWQ8_9LECA|nr:60s ribosomal protein l44 protein [Lasallia pustulata]